ncbi:hypothetical protein K1719_036570 [Acacia pycnantha]|nr:hypothetical protein K1719_036570 [Acacia pycnantha]
MTKQMGVSDFSLLSLLLLYLLLAKVQGICLDRESLAAVQQQKQHDDEESNLMEKSNGEADNEVILYKNKQCTKRRLSRVSTQSHKWLPSIHEDYYGPGHHRSRHH